MIKVIRRTFFDWVFTFLNIMEIWKIIEGFENYQISNLGRVKSLWFGKEKILRIFNEL